MGKEGKEYFHLTRMTYNKIVEFNKDNNLTKIILNRMIWDRDIYLVNRHKLVELYRFKNGVLYELEYEDYRMFFIKEFPVGVYRNNVFWVNILLKGTIYQNYKNESIMTYRAGKYDVGIPVLWEGKTYIGIHTGHAFTRYYNLDEPKDKNFWGDVKKYLNGEDIGVEFGISSFNNYLIVYTCTPMNQREIHLDHVRRTE